MEITKWNTHPNTQVLTSLFYFNLFVLDQIYSMACHFTGRHTVEILYAGQAIMGSPFYVEIYDPNKIRVEGTRRGMVGQKMEFDSGLT